VAPETNDSTTSPQPLDSSEVTFTFQSRWLLAVLDPLEAAENRHARGKGKYAHNTSRWPPRFRLRFEPRGSAADTVKYALTHDFHRSFPRCIPIYVEVYGVFECAQVHVGPLIRGMPSKSVVPATAVSSTRVNAQRAGQQVEVAACAIHEHRVRADAAAQIAGVGATVRSI